MLFEHRTIVRVLVWVLSSAFFSATSGARDASPEESPIEMPTGGICAHRGASDTHPENTLAAFREAIRLGVHMIEFDVALTKDNQLVLMHDATVDRTTDGTGLVSELTLAEVKKLDAGSWKGKQFAGERVPTLREALDMMPDNVWLNVHLKGGADLAERVAQTLVASERLHQSFLACGSASAEAAKRIETTIKICNMERQGNSLDYVNETIAMKADFIQILRGAVDRQHTKLLRERRIHINYCCTNDAEQVKQLFAAGVEFPLVDHVGDMLAVAESVGIERLRPAYRSHLTLLDVRQPLTVMLEQRQLAEGAATQGLALTPEHYFTSTAQSIYRYDHDWNLLEEKEIRIAGVNHLGAIDYHAGFIWAGLLHGPENGKHDPKLNRSIIAKIRATDLKVIKTWDITKDVTWIDPVCFDGQHVWVGDLSDLGIHRYRIDEDQLVRDGVLRYPSNLHFSQGIRVVGRRLFSIHTFGEADGIFEFALPEKLTEERQRPVAHWHVPESRMHLEGFDFVPGKPCQIWHAQGRQVDRLELSEITESN